MRRGTLLTVAAVVSCGLLVRTVLGQTPEQQRRDPAPARGEEPASPERDIFVPIWTEPIGPNTRLPASVARRRADYIWDDVALPGSRTEATEHPKGANATVLAIRPVSVREQGTSLQGLEVSVRLEKPVRPPAKPLLEVVDTATLLQSRAWGQRVRRTAEGEEWLFRLADPLPIPSGPRNPISARVLRTPDPSRRLQLHLVSEAPVPR